MFMVYSLTQQLSGFRQVYLKQDWFEPGVHCLSLPNTRLVSAGCTLSKFTKHKTGLRQVYIA